MCRATETFTCGERERDRHAKGFIMKLSHLVMAAKSPQDNPSAVPELILVPEILTSLNGRCELLVSKKLL